MSSPRLGPFRVVVLLLGGPLASLGAVTCATAPPAPPPAEETVAAPADEPSPPPLPDAGAPREDAAAPRAVAADAGADGRREAVALAEVPVGVVGTTPAVLPWVNPARCLSPCRFAPAPLVSIDHRGALAAAGPHRMAEAAQPALAALVAAAREAGHQVRVASAYRSYEEQVRLFRRTKEVGRAARPGHSEHQLGTTIDLRLPTTAAIDWLAANAPRFGFALSYPPGKQKLTGYRPEPWHVRYVGGEAASEIAAAGWTVEEFFRANPTRGQSGACTDCPAPASRAKCGRVTAAGVCRGTVLTWCYEGALATVDCQVSQQRCGPAPDTGEASCL